MILQLKPALKDYIWGGTRLKDGWGIQTDLNPLAEAWVVSAHPDGPSVISSAPYAGQTLRDYLAAEPGALGSANADGMPVLIKFIDAAQSLSVQLHPDDDYARRVEHDNGKSEMWYIADCAPGSFLYLGFNQAVTKRQFADALRDGTVEQLLRRVDVSPGDCVFVPAKTLHAIGAGCLILEVQQSSNATYRVFDFNRKGPDGEPRELHIEKALDVADLASAPRIERPPPRALDGGEIAALAQSRFFSADKFDIAGALVLDVGGESFLALVCLDGAGTLKNGDQTLSFQKGDAFFVPANSGRVMIAGASSFVAVSRTRAGD